MRRETAYVFSETPMFTDFSNSKSSTHSKQTRSNNKKNSQGPTAGLTTSLVGRDKAGKGHICFQGVWNLERATETLSYNTSSII